MKKTMMYLPEDLHRFLAAEAAARGVSMAELAREALARYRTECEEASPKGISALVGVFGEDVVDPDLSESVEATLGEYFAAEGAWEQENGLADCSR